MTPREAMDEALKDRVKADLRPRGFTGSLPHLRRRSAEQICLVSIQFFSSGGSFVAEVAECGPDGFVTSWGEHRPPQKVTARDIAKPRPRLGSPTFPVGDHWFQFGPRNYEPDAEFVHPRAHYNEIAAQVIQFIEEQAEPFWRQRLEDRS